MWRWFQLLVQGRLQPICWPMGGHPLSPQDRVFIERKMQMLQWLTVGPTTEAPFFWAGWRLALCLCHPQTHNSHHSDHSVCLTKEVGGSWKGLLTADKDARAKAHAATVEASYRGTFWTSTVWLLFMVVSQLPSYSLTTKKQYRVSSALDFKSYSVTMFTMFFRCCLFHLEICHVLLLYPCNESYWWWKLGWHWGLYSPI